MAKIRTDPGLLAAIKAVKTLTALAAGTGTTLQNVGKWKRIPGERVIQVEALTGVPREKLRPDLYPPRRSLRPRSRAPAHV
jgi:DNA-binding transcriptional regulator YdaS (Cro superfamily)